MAHECLRGARAQLAGDVPTRAVSEAYYGALYAARAALSEEGAYAKTHRGVWGQFGHRFVRTARFDRELARAGAELQDVRLGTDYEARWVPAPEAEELVRTAESFVEAVTAMLEGTGPA